MRRLIKHGTACLVGFILATAGIAMGPPNHRIDGDAVIDLPTRQVDLGIVAFQEERNVLFRIANSGQRRLVINELDRECSCGERIRRTLILRPGEAGDFVVSIDTRFTTGAIQKLTSLTTNDPAQPRFNLLVKASVQPTKQLAGPDLNLQKQASVLISQQETQHILKLQHPGITEPPGSP